MSEQNQISKPKRKHEYQRGELDSLLTRTEEWKPNLADGNNTKQDAKSNIFH
jgi:hypothetical protein